MKKKPEPNAARVRCKRHPKLVRIDSCTERCPACHWYSAMIATKRGVRRKWVRELGDATKAGKRATRHLLAIARACVGVAAAEYVRALPVPVPAREPTLREELAALLNRRSLESRSNTPDFVLAEYLAEALEAFDRAVIRRDQWYASARRPTDRKRESHDRTDV